MAKVANKMIPVSLSRSIFAAMIAVPFIVLFIVSLTIMPATVAALTGGLGVILVWISIVDLKFLIIPDLANLLVTILGAAAIIIVAPDLTFWHMFAAAVVFCSAWAGSELAYQKLGHDVFGMGDVKLLAAGTIWVGGMAVPSVLLISSVAAIMFAILIGRAGRKIPFGPFLSFAIYLIWVHGPIVV